MGRITKGPNRGDRAVVKVFKHPPLRSNYIDAKKELKVYSYANDYAQRFNSLLIHHDYVRTISFPEPDLVKIDSLTLWNRFFSGYFEVGNYICAEKYLRG